MSKELVEALQIAADALRNLGCAVDADEAEEVIAAHREAVPDVLFDGYAVFKALTQDARRRTSLENVSDVLDAVVRLMRPPAPAAEQPTGGA